MVRFGVRRADDDDALGLALGVVEHVGLRYRSGTAFALGGVAGVLGSGRCR